MDRKASREAHEPTREARIAELAEAFKVTTEQAALLAAAEAGEIHDDVVVRVLTEQELAQALEHTYGTSPGHAREIAASHHGKPHRCLPDDAYSKDDPRTVWKRSSGPA